MLQVSSFDSQSSMKLSSNKDCKIELVFYQTKIVRILHVDDELENIMSVSLATQSLRV